MSIASAELVVRSALPDDASQISDIYNHYVRTSTITFEEEPVSACAGKWKVRAAYRHACEITVYVRAGLERELAQAHTVPF